MRVFFYGLFMDEGLLASKGIHAADARTGFVDGYELQIGRRASLARRQGGRAYGVIMDIAPREAVELYAEDSVSDYLPEPVTVELMDGTKVEASCYNLPCDKIDGTNRSYAKLLLELAEKLQLPVSYLDQIRRAAGRSAD